MKKCFLCLTLVLISFSNWAQIKPISKEESAVLNSVEAFRKALIDPTESNLKALTSKDLSYGHSSGVLQDQKVFIEKLLNGESDFVTIEFQNQSIQVTGDVAIVRHSLAAHTKDSGVEKDIKIGNVLVWQKQKNKWLLIARQAFKLPQ
ncbi:nuclear transport factor 2 family protein [Flavobacterium sufflavum]|uniref:Nuclear transport factor 2 family protein n=1 Tax=Flavobacterium sufflavum TaxID=1921138 RepID=A0A437L0Z6_9FLAO|nr:nuclear transport factor 2 family protein [Flavobacterium sufflavum]RVT78626.1 nuclear transport factor 2 family protein [Flavobacterium sufflavum]